MPDRSTELQGAWPDLPSRATIIRCSDRMIVSAGPNPPTAARLSSLRSLSF